jgi:hypothetical protein
MRIGLTELSYMADLKLRSGAPFKYVWNYINWVVFNVLYNRIIVFLSIGEKIQDS